eukprot:6131031-Prymnesium_polylepis.1
MASCPDGGVGFHRDDCWGSVSSAAAGAAGTAGSAGVAGRLWRLRAGGGNVGLAGPLCGRVKAHVVGLRHLAGDQTCEGRRHEQVEVRRVGGKVGRVPRLVLTLYPPGGGAVGASRVGAQQLTQRPEVWGDSPAGRASWGRARQTEIEAGPRGHHGRPDSLSRSRRQRGEPPRAGRTAAL